MVNRTESFTHRAQNILLLAQIEAELLKQHVIKPEHILVALLTDFGSIGGTVLRELGLTLQSAHDYAQHVSIQYEAEIDQPIEFSDIVKAILEDAMKCAQKWGHHYVGTEHLLISLVNQDSTTVRSYFEQQKITPKDINERIEIILSVPAKPKKALSQRILNLMTLSVDSKLSLPTSLQLEYLKVLELIENGEISKDEGARLLEDMKPTSEITSRQEKTKKIRKS